MAQAFLDFLMWFGAVLLWLTDQVDMLVLLITKWFL